MIEVYEDNAGGIRVYSVEHGEILFAENYDKPQDAAREYLNLLDEPGAASELTDEQLKEVWAWYSDDLESSRLIACSRLVDIMPLGIDRYAIGNSGREFADAIL